MISLLFLYAGVTKLIEPQIFAVFIEAFGLVPEYLLLPVAIGLPILEVLSGFGLLFEIKGSLRVITALLVCFLFILGYGIWLGLDVDCGCFGPNDPESSAFHGLAFALFRDALMLTGIGFMYEWRRYRCITPIAITAIVQRMIRNRSKKDAYV